MDYVYIGIIIVLLIHIIYIHFYQKPKLLKKGADDMFEFFLLGAWQMRVDWFKTLNKYVQKDTTVLVGDSLTNEFLVTEMLPNKNICNRGIGGDTSEGVLKRMSESIFDLNPKQMFLLIGANDIQLTELSNDEIVSNINTICRQAKEYREDMIINCVSVAPVCETVLAHVDKETVGKRANERIREINKLIKKVAENNNYNYINLYDFLADENGSLRGEYTREGLHFSQLAYEKITEELRKLV